MFLENKSKSNGSVLLLLASVLLLLSRPDPTRGANECIGAETGDVCREAATACDVAEVCNVTLSADCPEDAFRPSTFVVRPSTSVDGCDPEETCSGVDSVVPPDINDCVTVDIKILGQSGKFTIFDKELGEEDPNNVTVQLDYLYEIAEDGTTKVGNTGNPKHSVETFANQDFTIEDPVDTTIGDGVGAQLIPFYSSVNGIGNIQMDTYVLKSNGTIETSTESWAVRTNDVKFSIVLRDWEFCDPCGNGNNRASSEFIDVAVEIKGRGGAPEEVPGDGDDGLSYDLGGGVPLELSNQIFVDGEWVSMADGFPKMEEKGGKALFVFRFPKFSQNATYDPVIGWSNTNDVSDVDTGDSDDEDDDSGGTALGNTIAFALVLIGSTFLLS